MEFKHKIINSADIEKVSEIRVSQFIGTFAEDTLGVNCKELTVKKDDPIKNKSTLNKNNWNNKVHLKQNTISVYDFKFNTGQSSVSKNKSAYILKYYDFFKDVQGKVYYSNGNIIRVVLSFYGEQKTMLNFIKFNNECHTIIDRYYRLSLASIKDNNASNIVLRGRIECSFRIKNGNCFIEHVISDEKIGQKTNGITVVTGQTGKAMSSSLSNLLLAVVDKKDNFYENFMIKFENNSIKSIVSKKLHKLQNCFPYFPKLNELVRSDSFDDYLVVLEMEQI
jgi:hypothetical protein